MPSATGGFANEANTFYKRLASLLASKWDYPYSITLCWLRCVLAFSLLRSAIQSIRGSRSSCGHAIRTPTVIDLVKHFICLINSYLDSCIHFALFCSFLLFYICIKMIALVKKNTHLEIYGMVTVVYIICDRQRSRCRSLAGARSSSPQLYIYTRYTYPQRVPRADSTRPESL